VTGRQESADQSSLLQRCLTCTGRIVFTNAGKQSSSTMWFSPAKQFILFRVTGYGNTSWNPHGQKQRRKCASTCNRRARCEKHFFWQTWQMWLDPLGLQAFSIFFSVICDTHLSRWRAVRGPVLARRPWIGVVAPVTGRWSFECNLKTSNSILIILKYCPRIQPGQ